MALTNSRPLDIAIAASKSARALASLSKEERNAGLTAVHDALAASKTEILQANAQDVATASRAGEKGEFSQSLLKRLDLGRPGKYEDMLKGILDVRELDDPVGKVTLRTRLDDGLDLERIACPIGVLLIIFEARPEVIANITALAIKSGNAAILKGGKESTESFTAISKVISKALESTKVPQDSIQLVTTRDAVSDLLSLDRYIDLVIPRGSNDLVRHVKNNTRIPVLGHADGLCTIYLHKEANISTACSVILDSKLGYPAACNSVETLLVDEEVLYTTLATAANTLAGGGVVLKCDKLSEKALITVLPEKYHRFIRPAQEEDYDTEFLDLVLAIKTIPSSSGIEQAIDHINTHSSHHTDAIITTNADIAERFLREVDSAGVYWNTSTRMADGLRYGFGTEVGISTNKIHARGPVGLEGLMIYKYVIRGQGHVAGDYHDGPGGRKWKHEKLPVD
ncbi:MAG: hypothetical protein M1823_002438 [Watsoniomyces obsoletus]|nr:MAG: hypothetical protein M1823_002438 [Watsoniomyces obsoletus]